MYEYVADVLERRRPHREAHLALVDRWHEGKGLLVAGATGDPPTGALFVFALPEAAIEEFVAADPYVAAGLVTSHRTLPWNVVVWGAPPGEVDG
ncbi:MAG TPA: YciI family protein [Solirubrobacterales bacterium]|nr:YciI family protein [Solirubrobacterales bacterium]